MDGRHQRHHDADLVGNERRFVAVDDCGAYTGRETNGGQHFG
jgi:hypothetical protein